MTKPARNKKERTISLRIPLELDQKATAAAKKLKLNKAAVLRLSTERGIDVLIQQLTAGNAA